MDKDNVNTMRRPVVALLLAGGHGYRMHARCPKQFISLEGTPVFIHPLLTLDAHAMIDAIYVVCSEEWSHFVRSQAEEHGVKKIKGICPAGETSIDSIRNGLEQVGKDWPLDALVVTHESVRPLVSAQLITDNITTALKHGNAITAIGSNEAFMESEDGVSSLTGIPREHLYRAQMPQSFTLGSLLEAFELAHEKGINSSQSLYTLMREVYPTRKLFIAPGSELNFKLTVPGDMNHLQALLQYKKEV